MNDWVLKTEIKSNTFTGVVKSAKVPTDPRGPPFIRSSGHESSLGSGGFADDGWRRRRAHRRWTARAARRPPSHRWPPWGRRWGAPEGVVSGLELLGGVGWGLLEEKWHCGQMQFKSIADIVIPTAHNFNPHNITKSVFICPVCTLALACTMNQRILNEIFNMQ